ncbi:MAG: hypothetical protein HQK84_05820 [Nitrospinae bacterium]|nr:hypothetical protein [Nitrospinota bacterium]
MLGYHELTESDKVDFKELFHIVTKYPVTDEIIERTIELRQQRKITLGE